MCENIFLGLYDDCLKKLQRVYVKNKGVVILMKYIGAHVSIAGGMFNAPINATQIGAKAFAMFTKNQRQWQASPLTEEEIKQFKIELQKSGIAPKYVLPHDSYLINLGSPDAVARERSQAAFVDEIKRCLQLGLMQLNFHPGNHLNLISEGECLNLIAASINFALAQTQGITLIIENTSGQGSTVGYKFEHLATLIDLVNDKSRVGVCIDTCHLFASGYDIRERKSYNETWNAFEKIIGFQYLRAMHINDALSELGSKVDRHQSIGAGKIGCEAFKMLMQDERMDEIPLILETIEPDLWSSEISMLYKWCHTFHSFTP